MLVFLSLLVGLAIGEIGLQHFYYSKRRYCVQPPDLKEVFTPAPHVMPGIEGNSRFYINSMGIRGDEFDNSQEYRILVMGGSAAECLYLDNEEAWSYILQEKLNNSAMINTWVGNVAASGMTTRDNIMHMACLLDQYPRIDTVIILSGINDFALVMERSGKYDPDFLLSPGAENKQVEHAFFAYPLKKGDYYYENFALYKLIKRTRNIILNRTECQDKAGLWYAHKRKARKEASEIINEPPNLRDGLREYERNINAIIDLAEEESVRVIFLTQPYIWNPNLTNEERGLCWWGWIGADDEQFYSIEALAEGLNQYNRKLTEVCAARGVECIDLASHVPKNKAAFYDDVHFNENGSRRVAGIIHEYLKRKEPFNKQ